MRPPGPGYVLAVCQVPTNPSCRCCVVVFLSVLVLQYFLLSNYHVYHRLRSTINIYLSDDGKSVIQTEGASQQQPVITDSPVENIGPTTIDEQTSTQLYRTSTLTSSSVTVPSIIPDLPERLSNATEERLDVSRSTTTPPSTTAPSATETCIVGRSANTTDTDCADIPAGLVGPIKVWFDAPPLSDLEAMYPQLCPGGHHIPTECRARHRVAVIVPYRDRQEHLRILLQNLHSLLKKQRLDYAIYIVEQVANQTFNRAKLMNVGYAVALQQYDWQCFVFHDVDLYPEDDRNIYSCPDQPRHMSVAVDKFNYKLPYKAIFGGVTALTKEHMETVNGFSNSFWGWGGEDDEMSSRLKLNKLSITRYPSNIARYRMQKHDSDSANPLNDCRFNLMYKVNRRFKNDGLTSLRYKLLSVEPYKLYTHVLADLDEADERERLSQERVCAKSKS